MNIKANEVFKMYLENMFFILEYVFPLLCPAVILPLPVWCNFLATQGDIITL